jgi:hypothetical protein
MSTLRDELRDLVLYWVDVLSKITIFLISVLIGAWVVRAFFLLIP